MSDEYTKWHEDGFQTKKYMSFRCKVCGESFRSDRDRMQARINHGRPVYCPHGHAADGSSGDTHTSKLEREVLELEKRAASLQRSLTTSKGNYTRLRQRLEANNED